jgi:hypothetical protein
MPHKNSSSDYDTLVELRRRMLTPNDTGERESDYPPESAYATVWAKRNDIRGDKRFIANSLSTDQLVEFSIRWRGDMQSTDHIFIVADGTEHEVMQIADVGRRVEHNILSRRLIT